MPRVCLGLMIILLAPSPAAARGTFVGTLRGVGQVAQTQTIVDYVGGSLVPKHSSNSTKNDLTVHVTGSKIRFQRGKHHVVGTAIPARRADGTTWLFFRLEGATVRAADRLQIVPAVGGPGLHDAKNYIKGMIVIDRAGRSAKLTGRSYLGGTRANGDGAWRTTTFTSSFEARSGQRR